ncbi:MAG: mechanosensitive ion channel family protein [Armatimonadota bacterium]
MSDNDRLLHLVRTGSWSELGEQGLQLVILAGVLLLARTFLARVCERVARDFGRRASERQSGRVRTLIGLARSIADFVLLFVFAVSVLGRLGINVTAIVGTASVAGLAFGFGAQKLIKDLISGFILLLEDQYAVGETVTIGAVTGTVEELGMRVTRIRDDEGRMHVLGNGDITAVCNHARGPVGGQVEIGIAAHVLPRDAELVLRGPLESMSKALGLAETARVEGVSSGDHVRTGLRVGYRLAPGQNPARVAASLRATAREALIDAGIPLG